jgi:hypothetical protein
MQKPGTGHADRTGTRDQNAIIVFHRNCHEPPM